MENMDSLVTWQPSQLLIAGLVVVVVNMSLGFSLWKALSHSLWTPYWHVSSLITGVGALSLAITISRVITNEFLVNLSWATMTVGILMTLGGAAINVIHYMSLYRNPNNHHRHA